jgi:hypothetical protein
MIEVPISTEDMTLNVTQEIRVKRRLKPPLTRCSNSSAQTTRRQMARPFR